jgi:hypothetical protein
MSIYPNLGILLAYIFLTNLSAAPEKGFTLEIFSLFITTEEIELLETRRSDRYRGYKWSARISEWVHTTLMKFYVLKVHGHLSKFGNYIPIRLLPYIKRSAGKGVFPRNMKLLFIATGWNRMSVTRGLKRCSEYKFSGWGRSMCSGEVSLTYTKDDIIHHQVTYNMRFFASTRV